MKLEDLKIGLYFVDKGVLNEESEDYGPLLIKKIIHKTAKFDTNWYSQKSNYIDREQVEVEFTNHKGKKVCHCWWEDEFEHFEKYVVFEAKNKKEAYNEFLKMNTMLWAIDAAEILSATINAPGMRVQYTMDKMNTIEHLREAYEATNNEGVKEVLDAAIKLSTACKKFLKENHK